MGFIVHKVNEVIFNSLPELKEYTIIERANTDFVPIINFLENKAKFVDDEYFGYNKTWYTFNDEAFHDLCKNLIYLRLY